MNLSLYYHAASKVLSSFHQSKMIFQAELIRKQGDPQNYYVNEYFGSSLPQESPRNNKNKRKSKNEHFPEKNIEVITKNSNDKIGLD